MSSSQMGHFMLHTYLLPFTILQPTYLPTHDAPSHSLKYSNANLKMKIIKEKGVEVCSLARSTLGVERRARVPGWGLGRVTSG
jgi:hypothetical protein